MSVALAATTTTTTEVKLKPAVKAKLLKKLKVFAELRAQIKTLEAAADKEKADIRVIREEVGVETLKVDGYTTTNVTNTRQDSLRFREALIEMGVTTDMLDEAKERSLKAGRPYEKITVPGERNSGDSE